MRKVFGIADENYAYFYEMNTNNEINKIIEQLNHSFYMQKKDIILCDFYDNKVHNYGRYQKDINNGYASVIDTRVMHIDKRTNGLSRINFNPCFGVVELIIAYPSQISKIIKNTFNPEDYTQQYKPIDFTDIIKIVNSIDDIPNTFTQDSIVDKKYRYMNTSFSDNLDDVNKKQFLNEKEKGISLNDYHEIICKITDNIEFKLVAIYDLEKKYNEEIENMKRYAIRNSKIIDMPIFNPILTKIGAPINNHELIKKKKEKKKEYKDNYNVYLQNSNNYDIM